MGDSMLWEQAILDLPMSELLKDAVFEAKVDALVELGFFNAASAQKIKDTHIVLRKAQILGGGKDEQR